ncbi:MAG: MerR family transcriptional regulator [Clostridia bacterium]|nr:MerR family transcriptional regulator [Clostridia bacterium]
MGRYTIGQVERKTGLSQRQIRYYELKGIVRPERTAGGHRLFSEDDVARLQTLASYLSRGYTLAQALDALQARSVRRRVDDLPAKEGFVRPETPSLYPLVGRDQFLRRLRERERDNDHRPHR